MAAQKPSNVFERVIFISRLVHDRPSAPVPPITRIFMTVASHVRPRLRRRRSYSLRQETVAFCDTRRVSTAFADGPAQRTSRIEALVGLPEEDDISEEPT